MQRLIRAMNEAEKWIGKAIKHPGALKKAFPKMAKGGFSNKELKGIMKRGTAKQKKQARLAMTLKGFKKGR